MISSWWFYTWLKCNASSRQPLIHSLKQILSTTIIIIIIVSDSLGQPFGFGEEWGRDEWKKNCKQQVAWMSRVNAIHTGDLISRIIISTHALFPNTEGALELNEQPHGSNQTCWGWLLSCWRPTNQMLRASNINSRGCVISNSTELFVMNEWARL